jgi:ABC-2 type transport system ATP-binding protein
MPRPEAEERIASLVDTIELGERINDGVRTYSGGMRRRLEIARAVLARPRILFLDEPTVGLDPAARHTIWDLIQRLRREDGVTVVLTTHYMDEAERLCDRVAIIHEGRIVALDTPQALVESLGEEVLELQVNGEADKAVRVLGCLRVGAEPLVTGKTVALPLSGDGSATQLMEQVRSSGLLVAGIGVRRTTLDDVFIHLTGSRISGENGN